MASTSGPRRSARGPAAETFLPDVIWEEIFLRLDGAADLARASAACSAFRRVVSEPRFAALFRSLRSPAVLGFISRDRHQFVPVDPPHRSASEGCALGLAADFIFLPGPHAWDFRHARDGRVLLSRVLRRLVEFVVCDPLHRRYVTIPRIPNLPEFRTAYPNVDAYDTPRYGPVLAPAGENDDERSFRVIRTVQTRLGQVMAFVFSSCNQEWTCINSTRCLPKGFIEYVPYYAHDCLYWVDYRTGRYLALVAHHIISDESPPNSEHFVLDIKTLLVEKLCTSNNGMFYGFPYARFPPLLALPSI